MRYFLNCGLWGFALCLSRLKVFFKVTVGMIECPADGGDRDVVMSVRPVGFNESVSVRIRQSCVCGCAQTGRCRDDPSSSDCPGETSACRAHRSAAVCSGRGVCKCASCVCDSSRLGNIYGKFCEMDDFSCPYVKGLVCGGERRDVFRGLLHPKINILSLITHPHVISNP
ncbi:hypothetical protein cypCar_00044054 [Cyprinus carpio]|nr:hypothetical protein cypCar_00044054 [Cyprinus carpio]